ncbi:uncharacterized protein N7511_007594 [Penicillium nucicola]|uniref:uncharacterized protein n=1 Tax=Penicillium nucicola TaxID=1850975 RepID=UPI0025456594|nr:uncharacterized protein N7511_007594 [Penicillium nucicola]KAJ5753441.1 hypothetical protein N7511_007594 [Penicillium nucicola]
MPDGIFIQDGWYVGEEDPNDHDNPWYVNVFFKDNDMRKSDEALMEKLARKLWNREATITTECLHHTRSHCISLLIDHDGTDTEKLNIAYLLTKKIQETVYAGKTTISRNKLFRGEGLGIDGFEYAGSQVDYR